MKPNKGAWKQRANELKVGDTRWYWRSPKQPNDPTLIQIRKFIEGHERGFTVISHKRCGYILKRTA